MSAALKSHSIGSTMVLTISHPSARNALVPAICAAGVEALNAADSNPEVHALVLTGEGSDFCAGGPWSSAPGQNPLPVEVQAESLEILHSWIEAIHSFSKPVIAAVEGSCSNAGFSLALACDFLIAARNSTFEMELAGTGLMPQGGGSWSLVRNLPRPLAMQLLMLGERTTAERLEPMGLVNHISEPGQALSLALELSQRLHRVPTKALASIKELANDAMDHSLNAHLKLERDLFLRNRLRWGSAGEVMH